MKSLARLVVTAAVSLIAAGAWAQAADWRGFYLGVSLGAASGKAEARTTASGTSYFAESSLDAIAQYGAQELQETGAAFAGLAGYNFSPLGPVVLGLESDFGVLRFDESARTTAEYPCCPPTAFTIEQSVETTWLVTARARAGVPLGRWLPFATAGVAWTHVEYRERFTDNFASATGSGAMDEPVWGLAVGGGVEYWLGTPWSGRLEFLYADFEGASTTSNNLIADFGGGPVAYPDQIFHHAADLRTSMVRAGASYRF